ncbi:MAG: hypothetical protein M3040_11325 [Bacteroidota bacterium]|nr:hypothetical protein [Bacteroidota bacterium]
MQITLLRTGGIIPITKQAEKEVDWSEEEMNSLLTHIKAANDSPGQPRDATGFLLKHSSGTDPINWDKIPAKYLAVFEDLKNNLKIVKGWEE